MRLRALGLLALVHAVSGCACDDGSDGAGPGGTGGSGGTAGQAGMAGAAGAAGEAPVVIPAHGVNEQKTHSTAVDDAAFDADTPTLFRTTDVLPDLDVRSIAIAAGRVYAGTATGVVRMNDAGTSFASVAGTTGPVVDLAASSTGGVYAARADGIDVIDTAGALDTSHAASGETISAVTVRGTEVIVGSDQGLSRLETGGLAAISAARGFAVVDLAASGNVVYAATASDVRRFDAVAGNMLPAFTGTELADPTGIAAASSGSELLVATAAGLVRVALPGGAKTVVAPAVGGLPTGDLTSVAEADGTVLTGHAIGATALAPDAKQDYYFTFRWLPADAVTDVAVAADGTRWVATNAGISRIAFVSSTLADKATYNESLTDLHWRMDGIMDDGGVRSDAWDLSEPLRHGDNDNDGLWTHMQIAAWCFAYATTGDEAFYIKAKRAMDTIKLFFDVPWTTFQAMGLDPGFITRSLVRSDEGAIYDDKATRSNWHLQEFGGQTYYWKDDTSSDEYTGHYFGIPIYYDLCAKTEEEKQALADRAGQAMRYVIENDLLLLDLDGEGTTHGDWQGLADAVDGLSACFTKYGGIAQCTGTCFDECVEGFGGGGWLNSIEILGFLLATWHMTKEDWFYEQYERLHTRERYGEMVPLKPDTLTVVTRAIANHSDHELASLAYYTLLRYERDPARLEIWKQSIRDMWTWEEEERNALEIAVMTSAIDDAPIADAVRTLQEMPRDWREWRYDNSHRKDVVVDSALDRHQNPQFTTVLPYDEIRTMKWNGNPYAVVGGGDGRSQQGPWPWLLPYWMMRYYAAIR